MMKAPLPDIAAPAAPPRRLPFSFAKRQGLLFLCLEEQYWLACRPQVELAAIAEARPTDPAGLLAVPGIGPVKFERFGPQLLALIASVG